MPLECDVYTWNDWGDLVGVDSVILRKYMSTSGTPLTRCQANPTYAYPEPQRYCLDKTLACMQEYVSLDSNLFNYST